MNRTSGSTLCQLRGLCGSIFLLPSVETIQDLSSRWLRHYLPARGDEHPAAAT